MPSETPQEIESAETEVGTQPDDNAQRVLSDNVVTPAEYEATMLAVVECANNLGASIDPIRLDPPDFLPDYQISDADIGYFDRCYGALGRSVDIAYQTQDPTVTATAARAEEVATCLADAGIDYRELAARAIADHPAEPAVDELSLDEMVRLAIGMAGLTGQESAAAECAASL